jgi:long-chain fatty acid transport protein
MEEQMNRFSSRLMLVLCVLMISSSLFAGSVDYLSNQSAQYMMTYTRNASTDASADIVNFNPAGAAYLPQGLYFSLSNQTLMKPYSQDSTTDYDSAVTPLGMVDKSETLEQDLPTYYLPNFDMIYSFGDMGYGKLAGYFQAGIVGGGGKLEWENGSAATNYLLSAISGGTSTASGGAVNPLKVSSQSFIAHSVYYGVGAGVATSFLNDLFSVSLGARYVWAQRNFEVNAIFASGMTLKGSYDYEATGITPIAGLDIKPSSSLTIGIRYEYETKLEFEYNQDKLTSSNGTLLTVARNALAGSGISDGKKFNYNLPQILGLGVEYAVNPDFSVMTSANIYFLSLSDMGKTYNSGVVNGSVNDYFGTGYELSLGATYKIIKELKLGVGFLYTESGAKKSYFENQFTFLNASANPPLDSIGVTMGGTYSIESLNLDITLTGTWIHYIPLDYSFAISGTASGVVDNVSGTYEKDVYDIALGVACRI